MKLYTSISEIRNQVETLYRDGLTRGVYCGFETLDDYYTLKAGGVTYVYGIPTSGKTEFWLDVLISLSEMYGYKHVVYLPESGNSHEIAAELISKAAKKPFYKQFNGYMTEKDMYRYMDFVQEHFYIIDPKDGDLTLEEFYRQVELIEQTEGVKINTTCCDPWNELKHEYTADGRQDLYIENRLGFITRNARKCNRHNVIITHCRDQQPIKGHNIEGREVSFYPPPTPREIAGGQAWYRKAHMLVCVWRPPPDVIDQSTNQPFESNECHVIIQKFKPKGTGKKGTVKLYYDATRNRYYERVGTQSRYAGARGEGKPASAQPF